MEEFSSKTEKNLWEAFIGESQARNKYTYYASIAKKEGYEQISAFFLETAENEKEHAKIWFRELGGLSNTVENMKAAAAGEHSEWTDMYPRMAAEAREEGLEHIAKLFENIGKIEKEHEERFKQLLENLEEGKVFKKNDTVYWKCRNCGHIHEGREAPEICPVCEHLRAFFEVRGQNY